MELKDRCNDVKDWSLTRGIFSGFELTSNLTGLAAPRSENPRRSPPQKKIVFFISENTSSPDARAN